MVAQVHDHSPDGDRSPVVEYGAVVVLWLAVLLLQAPLGRLLMGVDDLAPTALSHRLLETILYSVVGLAGLGGAAFVAVRTTDIAVDRLESARVGVALAAGLLVPASYLLAGSFPALQAGTVFDATMLALVQVTVALMYARVRGLSLKLDFPTRTPMVGNAVVGSVLVVTLGALSGLIVAEGALWLVKPVYGSALSVPQLVHDRLIPSVIGAVGGGLLLYGVIQESLRRHLTPASAVAILTTLVGTETAVMTVVVSRILTNASDLGIDPPVLGVVIGAALIVLPALVWGLWRLVGSGIDPDRAPVVAGGLAVAVVTVLALALWLLVPDGPPRLVGYAVTYATVAGIGAVAYEYTRSVWVPVLALLVFNVAMDGMTYVVSLSPT